MKKKSGLPVLVQFFISHFVLILVFVVGLFFINMSYSDILRRFVSDTAQQELRKSAELMQTRLDEMQSSAFTLAREDTIARFSAPWEINVDELALVYKLNQRILASFSNNRLVSGAMVYFFRSGSAWVNQNFLDAGLVQAAGKDYRINDKPFAEFFLSRQQDGRLSRLEMASVSVPGMQQEQLIVTFDLYTLSNFKSRAFVAYLLDMEQINKLLSSSTGSNDEGLFYILDATGKPVFMRAGSAATFAGQAMDEAQKALDDKDQIPFSYQPEGSTYTYYLSLPDSYIASQVWAGQRASLFFAIAALLIALGLAWYMARVHARPVQQLVELAPVAVSGDRNEFHALSASLNRLLQDKGQMEEALNRQMALQKNTVFSKLFSFGYRSEENAAAALAKVDVFPEGDALTAVYLHFTHFGEMDNLSARLVLETMLTASVPGVLNVSPMSDRSYAMCVCLTSERTIPALQEQLERALAEIRREYKFSVTCVIGPEKKQLLDLPASLQCARRAYYALDLAQHGQVFIAPEQEESQENAWQLPEVTKHQLMNLCQAGDMDMLEQVLRSFFDAQMRKWAPSRLEMEQLSFDLRGLMIHLQQMTQGLTLEPVALAVNTLPSLQDPGQLLEQSLQIFRVFCQQMNAHRANSSHRLYTQIRAFIQQHYTEQSLSLTRIADEFNMNEKYLSQLYKKEGNLNLAAEIEELRLKRAIELMAQPELSLAEICESCGYGSLNSFYKAFKRVYAVSPSNFRKTLNQSPRP